MFSHSPLGLLDIARNSDGNEIIEVHYDALRRLYEYDETQWGLFLDLLSIHDNELEIDWLVENTQGELVEEECPGEVQLEDVISMMRDFNDYGVSSVVFHLHTRNTLPLYNVLSTALEIYKKEISNATDHAAQAVVTVGALPGATSSTSSTSSAQVIAGSLPEPSDDTQISIESEVPLHARLIRQACIDRRSKLNVSPLRLHSITSKEMQKQAKAHSDSRKTSQAADDSILRRASEPNSTKKERKVRHHHTQSTSPTPPSQAEDDSQVTLSRSSARK